MVGRGLYSTLSEYQRRWIGDALEYGDAAFQPMSISAISRVVGVSRDQVRAVKYATQGLNARGAPYLEQARWAS